MNIHKILSMIWFYCVFYSYVNAISNKDNNNNSNSNTNNNNK